MGLSSSQGRLLMLTARLGDIELQQMIISQRQNQLAWKEADVAKEYSEAMNNYKLVMKVPDEEGKRQEKDLTYSTMTSMGYLITNSSGKLCLNKKELTRDELIAKIDEELALPETTEERKAELNKRKEELSKEDKTYTETTDEWEIPVDSSGNPLITITGNKAYTSTGEEFEITDGSSFLNKKEQLQNLLINGVLFVKNSSDANSSFSPTSELLESNTDFEYVLDTSDDAAAEAKHNYETSLLSAKENMLEMDLAQLETQHEAVMKEYESVKELISNNVDRTFKLFSNG